MRDSESAHGQEATLDGLLAEAAEVYRTAPGSRLERARAALRILMRGGGVGTLFRLLFGWRQSSADALELAPADEIALAVEAERHESIPSVGDSSAPVDEEPAAGAEAELEPESAAEQSSLAAFLERAEAETKQLNDDLKGEIDNLSSFDRIVRGLLVAAGGAALLLAVIGIALALVGAVAVAVVSGAVAILPAAGTAILFRVSENLHARLEKARGQRTRNTQALEALRAIGAIDDPEERRRQFTAYAEDRRRERAGVTAPPAS